MAAMQQIAAEILVQAHVVVEIAANGTEAVGKYAESLQQGVFFAAILMDIQNGSLNFSQGYYSPT